MSYCGLMKYATLMLAGCEVLQACLQPLCAAQQLTQQVKCRAYSALLQDVASEI